MDILKWLRNLFRYRDPEEEYLEQSTDLADLERRIKELEHRDLERNVL